MLELLVATLNLVWAPEPQNNRPSLPIQFPVYGSIYMGSLTWAFIEMGKDFIENDSPLPSHMRRLYGT